MSYFPVGIGGERLLPLIRTSLAQSTWTTYGKAWEEWSSLIHDRQVDVSEAARLEVTVDFLLRLRDNGASAALAQRRLTGISFHFKLRGWSDVTKEFSVRQALKGWRRELVCSDSRRPISFCLLLQLLDATASQCASAYEVLLFKTCFCLAFFAALRVGELVPPSRVRPGGLQGDDVVLANDAIRIRIRRSKTDVLGRGEWIPLQRVGGTACPVSVVSQYLEVRARGVSFLVHEDGSPVSRFQFTAVLKRCLAQAGVNPDEYGTHSFRIGAATEAARAGCSNSDIQRIGRWRSACFASYVRPELLD